jgi:hypothetical protein
MESLSERLCRARDNRRIEAKEQTTKSSDERALENIEVQLHRGAILPVYSAVALLPDARYFQQEMSVPGRWKESSDPGEER